MKSIRFFKSLKLGDVVFFRKKNGRIISYGKAEVVAEFCPKNKYLIIRSHASYAQEFKIELIKKDLGSLEIDIIKDTKSIELLINL